MNAGRCGLPMQRCERGTPVLEDPVCGRPAGHSGYCRSESSLARIRLYDSKPARRLDRHTKKAA